MKEDIKNLIKESMDSLEDLKLLTIVDPIISEVLKIEKEFGSFGDAPANEITERLLKIVKESKFIKLEYKKREGDLK